MAQLPTPGPWHCNAILGNRIVGDETAPKYEKIHVASANAGVATVYHARDARLIAQAPAMLALLHRAMEAEDPDEWMADAVALMATIDHA